VGGRLKINAKTMKLVNCLLRAEEGVGTVVIAVHCMSSYLSYNPKMRLSSTALCHKKRNQFSSILMVTA